MPASLAVFLSHNGKTLQLSCSPSTRVEAVQQALVALTGVPLGEQIMMCEGARLDPHKPLSAYGLPVDDHDQPHDVFLYNRAMLKPGAPPPQDEPAPDIQLHLPAPLSAADHPHSLDQAPSPLLRALPEYQRHFRSHLEKAAAYADASQLRYAACAQLVSEQEVQALSIDAARSNVEAHFTYICSAFEGFMRRYAQQSALHAEVLGSFEDDLAFLAATELHPALHAAGFCRLIDLVDAAEMRQLWGSCSRSHAHFAAKVSELEQLFGLLKGDVESLFMTAPSVDLEALGSQLGEVHAQLGEQASIAQALSADLSKVQAILEQTAAQLGAATSSASISLQLPDACQMLEAMHDSHEGHLLPRVAECDAALQAFTQQCVACKNALSRDVQRQLQCIASQQSRIREMRDKLAVYGEALGKQEGALGSLLSVRRVPAAYKQCLAECVRRAAFTERYAQSAAKLAESMGRFREKEVATRDAFRQHVEKHIPAAALERMGLLEQPPHCQVSLPSSSGEQLMLVTVDEMRRFQLPWSTASIMEGGAQAPKAAVAPSAEQQQQAGSGSGSGAEQQQQQGDEGAAAAAYDDLVTSLQVENARLRSELAAQVALECVRAAQLPAPSAAAAAAQLQQQHQQQLGPQPSSPSALLSPAGASGGLGSSGPASPLASSSAAAMAAAAAAAAGAGAASLQQVLPAGAAQKFERALAAKDGLIGELQVQLARAKGQVSSYEQRILSLEEQLNSLAASQHHQASAVPPAAQLAATQAPDMRPQESSQGLESDAPGSDAPESGILGSPLPALRAAAQADSLAGSQLGGGSGVNAAPEAAASPPPPAATAAAAAVAAQGSRQAASGMTMQGVQPGSGLQLTQPEGLPPISTGTAAQPAAPADDTASSAAAPRSPTLAAAEAAAGAGAAADAGSMHSSGVSGGSGSPVAHVLPTVPLGSVAGASAASTPFASPLAGSPSFGAAEAAQQHLAASQDAAGASSSFGPLASRAAGEALGYSSSSHPAPQAPLLAGSAAAGSLGAQLGGEQGGDASGSGTGSSGALLEGQQDPMAPPSQRLEAAAAAAAEAAPGRPAQQAAQQAQRLEGSSCRDDLPLAAAGAAGTSGTAGATEQEPPQPPQLSQPSSGKAVASAAAPAAAAAAGAAGAELPSERSGSAFASSQLGEGEGEGGLEAQVGGAAAEAVHAGLPAVADEGSDVEGIEAVTDDDEEDA